MLPTEEDIRAAGLKLTAHLTVEPMLRDMAKRYFRQGARWAISNMSGSPTVGKERGDASVSGGTCSGGSCAYGSFFNWRLALLIMSKAVLR
jgi:hypothetical protein